MESLASPLTTRAGSIHYPGGDRALPNVTMVMSDVSLSEPLLVFALRREASHFLQEFEPQQRFAGAPCRAYFAGPSWLTVLVMETGVGPEAAETALHWALGKPLFGNLPYRPKLVLSAGFAGGLVPRLKVGDLVLAKEVADLDGRAWPAPWPAALPADWQQPVTRGRVLTTTTLVSDPADKRRLCEEHQALVVDMESAVVARACKERGVPFGCLRVVSDDWEMPLSPALAGLTPAGRVSWWRLLSALIRSPRLASELWRLAKQTKTAARKLGLGLGELLTLTLDWLE
jgi:adenosylhomocysteine nucleosidase